MNNGLTVENMLFTLPEVLRQNEQMQGLAAGVAELLAQRPADIERLLIYPRIDNLPEELLDRLAYDFKVDWWDAEYTLAEKRQTLQDSWQIHRHLGTKAAVERAISAIYPKTKVLEWFEYGGEPYHFKLLIALDLAGDTPEKRQRVLERLNYYKNLRSHLEIIEYYPENPVQQTSAFAGGAVCGSWSINAALPALNWELPMGMEMYAAGGYQGIMQTTLPKMGGDEN